MPEYDGDRFHARQVVVAVARERMPAVWELVNRMTATGYSVTAIAVVEHHWEKTNFAECVAQDPAAFLKRIAWGPVAHVDWEAMTPIDRPTFTDRWLRTVGCGMAYGPGLGELNRERVDPVHYQNHDDVLAMFDPDCEIRHNYDEEVEGGHSARPVTNATFDTCFVLRDAFGEED